ncbi:MASE3 domain-containing protein [Methanosarcina sp. WWM596]|uniref:MASE3 domain-containing protein n=1 Tax=Methanosarcina sp. WWM596 TaxID=1434103 RepID=UPI00064E288E|nr:MASE3 domain-containing protein [Methanosarcina sp. WWM596]
MYHIGRKTFKVRLHEAAVWITIIGLLYLISLGNYLLFHTLAELFSVYVAYAIFFMTWKSRTRLENRYLLLIGIAFFFIGSVDFLHALTFRGMGVFPDFGIDLTAQLWIVARYLESISFLVAPLFLIRNRENRNKEAENRHRESIEGSTFAWKVFLVYAAITIFCLLSIFIFKNFPVVYIEGSGLTPFKILSEYIISFILLCSLFPLYIIRDKFKHKVYRLLAASIIITILGELSFILYTHVNEFPNLIGHYFKLLSFYLIYEAVVDVGFEEPYSLLFRELKHREESFRQKTIFLGDEYSHICRMIGVNRILEPNNINFEEDKDQEGYHSFSQHFPGIGFQLDGDFAPISIQGPVEEMTGYGKEDFLSGKVSLIEIIVPDDQPLVFENRQKSKSNPKFIVENEFRIRKKNGETIWVREISRRIPGKSKGSGKIQGLIYDITERKVAEEALEKIDRIRIKEIHHRIKNNLQVISSLLSLQAEKFEDREVIEAFRESQNRVASIALIHEELHGGDNLDALDFAGYLQKLTADIFNSYRVGKDGLSLKLDLEQVFLGMDTAIPLGIIVNELVSNAMKHAFSDKKEGEIHISLHSKENPGSLDGLSGSCPECLENNNFHYVLTVADNGRGIPEEIDFRNADSLGLQLLTILVEQIDGCIELNRDHGTEFIIWFSNSGN